MHVVAWALALLMRYLLRYRVSVARANLAQTLPGLTPAARARILRLHYLRLAEVLFELPWLTHASAAELAERLPISGMDAVQAELAAGHPVLLLTAHLSNWEWILQAVAAQLTVPFIAAYKPPHGAAADRQMLAVRGRFGAKLVPAKRLLRELARQRGRAHVVGMVADQMPTSSAGRVWLMFLGRETAFFPGPGEIARIGGYRSFVMAQRRIGPGRYVADCLPLATAGEQLDVAAYTSRYAAQLERLVVAHPEEWAWTHRRWKLERPPGAALAAGAALAPGAGLSPGSPPSSATATGAGAPGAAASGEAH
jgi:KDO2-lipid IV(A) lauroyltransferase